MAWIPSGVKVDSLDGAWAPPNRESPDMWSTWMAADACMHANIVLLVLFPDSQIRVSIEYFSMSTNVPTST